MPELPECRIMSNYINFHAENKIFKKIFYVERGNNAIDSNLIENFKIESRTNGKEIKLKVYHDAACLEFSIFMGMSGNWKWVPTENWNETRFVRMRIDSIDGNSLLLYGSYMGPKYRLGEFTGVKRGPDPTLRFEEFKSNVLNNLHNKVFNKPLCEVLLDQRYFNGLGNYLRSTIIYYVDINPFMMTRDAIRENVNLLDMCRDIPLKAMEFNGAQLIDWKNPFNADYDKFLEWVFYKKGLSCVDNTGRTFWYHEKWKDFCPYSQQ